MDEEVDARIYIYILEADAKASLYASLKHVTTLCCVAETNKCSLLGCMTIFELLLFE